MSLHDWEPEILFYTYDHRFEHYPKPFMLASLQQDDVLVCRSSENRTSTLRVLSVQGEYPIVQVAVANGKQIVRKLHGLLLGSVDSDEIFHEHILYAGECPLIELAQGQTERLPVSLHLPKLRRYSTH